MNDALVLTLKGLKASFKAEDEGSFKRRLEALESNIYVGDWVTNDTTKPHRHLNGLKLEYRTREGGSAISKGEYLDFKGEDEVYGIVSYRVLRPYLNLHFPSEALFNAIELLNNSYENEDYVAFEKAICYLEYRLNINPDRGWIKNLGSPPDFTSKGELIEIQLRDGESRSSTQDGLRWTIRHDNYDIISYRRVPTLP